MPGVLSKHFGCSYPVEVIDINTQTNPAKHFVINKKTGLNFFKALISDIPSFSCSVNNY